MADSKISALASGSAGIGTDDVFPIARSNANFKLSLGDVFTLASGTITNPATGSPYSFPAISISGTATVATGVFNTGVTLNCPVTTSNGAGLLNQVLASGGPAAAPTFVNNFPVGGIIMWGGSVANIPSGWQLCDGTNGTPDLRNKFIIGAYTDSGSTPVTTVTGSNTTTGGDKDAYVVAHSHPITEPNSGTGHAHNVVTGNGGTNQYGWVPYGGGGAQQTGSIGGGGGRWYLDTISVQNATTGISINTVGTSGTNGRLPPYYALAFIMKMVY